MAECGVQGAGAWLRDDDGGLEIEEGGREEALVEALIAWLDASKAALGERINGRKEEEEGEIEPVKKKKNMFEYFSAALDRFIAFEGPLAERDVRLCKMVVSALFDKKNVNKPLTYLTSSFRTPFYSVPLVHPLRGDRQRRRRGRPPPDLPPLLQRVRGVRGRRRAGQPAARLRVADQGAGQGIAAGRR